MEILASVVKFTLARPLAALGIAAGTGIVVGAAGRHYGPKIATSIKGMLAERAAKKLAAAEAQSQA